MQGYSRPFQLVPWQNDFIPALLAFSLQAGGGSLEDALFIFPHARPALYLERQIRLDERVSKPCLMPEILPVHNVFARLREDFLRPAVSIGKLDQVGLLLECVRAEQQEIPGSISRLPTDAQAFFPWGIRLANLFEDCFIHGVTPTNFLYLEDELAEYAAALLSRLASIHRRYLLALAERNWTTSGLTAFQIAESLIRQSFHSNLFRRQNIFIAGFYSPTGSEEALFHKLWSEHGAHVIVHGDPALAVPGERAHWSCSGLESWRAKWKTSFEPLGRPDSSGPAIHYYSGYDIHSQLAVLRDILSLPSVTGFPADSRTEEAEYGKATAVILPDTDLLLPTVHHLRDQDLNISMGYPLDKTALNRLVETVLTLQENRRRGGYYWKDCIRLLRHPYLKMLELRLEAASGAPESQAGGLRSDEPSDLPRRQWREFLHRLERQLREGRRYVDFPAMLEQSLLALEPGLPPELAKNLATLARELSDTLLGRWERVRTLEEVSQALEKLCAIMVLRGEKLWPRFPIDAECLYRFMQNVIPQLRNSALAAEQFQPRMLFMLLRQLVREERVPFDAFPLTALQIMGLLESRLLSFRKVFILEATDDLLPGGSQNDPLLPDSLRRELRLPDHLRKQQMTAYYFFRLLAGAQEAHLLWEEGTEAQGLLEAKKLKSRFIEELLWKEEQKRGSLLKPAPLPCSEQTDGWPLHQLSCAPAPLVAITRQIPATPALREHLERLLAHKKLSASKINSFLSCPLAFFFQELAGLKPLAEVAEDDDPSETGQLLHEALSAHYASKLGQELRKGEQSATELANNFLRTLAESHLPESFPQDALAALRRLTPLRLKSYLDRQPESTRIMALESEANADLVLADGSLIKLTGRIDRLDRRELAAVEIVDAESGEPVLSPSDEAISEGLILLDYKTGKLKPPVRGFWSDAELWREIRLAADPGSAEAEKQRLLDAVSAALQSNIQLPLYLYLLRHGSLDRRKGYVDSGLTDCAEVVNAAWVELQAEGRECCLFEEIGRSELTEILDRKIPALLKFVLEQLKDTRHFTARPGGHCSYCAYARLCKIYPRP